MTARESIHYYGGATNAKGKIEQVRVSFPNDKMTQEWTGRIYKSKRAADTSLERINTAPIDERDRLAPIA